MCPISNSTRPYSSGSSSGETGSVTDAYAGKDFYQDVIDLADTIPLSKIFDRYRVACNERQYLIKCPFKSHKGGRENTASFQFFPKTNSFYCHGCHVGGPFAHATHFVATMEGVQLIRAANKIIEVFANELGNVGDDGLISEDYGERLELMLDFSKTVRDFYETYSGEEARVYVDGVCELFDKLNLKLKPDNCALRKIIEQSKEYISQYKP